MAKSSKSPRNKPRGTLVAPKIAHQRATLLRTVNAPRLLSFSHKLPKVRETLPHGMHDVNSPTDRRRTSTGAKPSGHGINAPRGQWGG